MPATPHAQVDVVNRVTAEIRKPSGARAYVFGIDFVDKRTWYAHATQETDEAVGTGDGVTTAFQLAHGNTAVEDEKILDLTRGLVTDDHLMAPPGGSRGDYVPVVKVDDVELTAREPYEIAGGDYEIDFHEGTLTFFVAPAQDAVITATYWWVAADAVPTLQAGPPAGKQWTIDKAEAQISANFGTDDWLTDTIMMNVFHVASGMADPANEVRYYTYGNLLDYSAGSFVELPALAGPRGIAKPTQIFRWEYLTPIVLQAGFELRAWTKHGRALGGARATVVMYALEEDAQP